MTINFSFIKLLSMRYLILISIIFYSCTEYKSDKTIKDLKNLETNVEINQPTPQAKVIEDIDSSKILIDNSPRDIVTDTFIENGKSYNIMVKFENYDPQSSYADFSFKIYVDDIEIPHHSSESNNLVGCLYENPLHFDGRINTKIRHIEDVSGKVIGWSIYNIKSQCGSASMERLFLLIPLPDNTFQKFELDFKESIFFNPVNHSDIEIWYYYQEWGKTGTAHSYFVPSKKILSYDRYNTRYYIKNGDILINRKYMDSIPVDYLKRNYLGLFAAGIGELNPTLIEYAFTNYFDNTHINWYKRQEVPITKYEIDKIVETIKTNNTVPEKYRYLVRED